MNPEPLLDLIDASVVYRVALVFYGAYPLLMAIIWIVMSVTFFVRREVWAPVQRLDGFNPMVSVVIAAYCEEETIADTIEALLGVDYPAYEVIVVNDGSSDRTAEMVEPYLDTGRVRLLDKRVNEGKALALNDALPLCRGEILVLLDADIIASPSLLRSLVPHFASPRVAAVTGNPRVANRETLLQQLQSLEFSSIISVQRRAQRVWGRVLTVSGAVVAVRKTALIEVGRFSPDMATEDIELTWRMQRHFMDVRYEARAVVWMQVPPTVAELWKQRRRWARGLTQVLLRHWKVPFEWKTRRMWPVFYEAVASILWAYTFVLVTAYWIVASMLGHAPYGATPVPNLWGMLIASACVVQLLTGVLMDCRYDDKLLRHFPVAIVYPVIYWMLMSVITSIYTIEIFFRRQPEVQRWRIRRAAR